MTSMRSLLLLLMLPLSVPAFAIYRCEADGKISYSDTACANGKPLEIANPAKASAASAQQQLAQEKSEVKRLENERHKREAQEEKEQQRIAHTQATKKKKCDALARRVKWADEDAASVAGKSMMKAKRRAHHLTEQYDADCSK